MLARSLGGYAPRSTSLSRLMSTTPDYLILGGGSAGSVLANRLSADPSNSVHLLDAGTADTHVTSGIHGWKIEIPSALTYNLDPSSKANWHYETVPQKHMNGRVIDQPRGKVLGGSSCLNAMVYIRGHAEDYERWDEQLKGEEGGLDWSYGGCLPYFKKAQTSHTPKRSEQIDKYKGFDGPLDVTTGSQLSRGDKAWGLAGSPLFDAFVEAGKDAGYRATDDLNGYSQEGFGPMDQTVTPKGERCSTAKAYLRPALEANKNLTVRPNSMVNRLVFDENDKTKCIGAEFTDTATGVKEIVYCNKEVICCLGSIGSPQLLQVSGIGDGEHLSGLGIEVRVDNDQIGANLQDHLEFYVQYHCTKPVTLYPVGNWLPYPHKRVMVGLEWFLKGTGLAASNQFETGGFIRSRKGMRHPDLQYHFVPGAVVGQSEFLPHHAFQAHCGTMRPT
ncbi:hypothetical protein TeGR_g1068 [Tetraparma gracilis]|uniref:Glucose-methanol-choline oxidoreductase N-terminal domain-containing protein n=1 Tax=Tetraparma gracilis TaxID=2962635 RepID=A0ABQ6MPP9_9STRA|nr:hypothetical protein TeGR_g1068 [Tetraparma gracilis]